MAASSETADLDKPSTSTTTKNEKEETSGETADLDKSSTSTTKNEEEETSFTSDQDLDGSAFTPHLTSSVIIENHPDLFEDFKRVAKIQNPGCSDLELQRLFQKFIEEDREDDRFGTLCQVCFLDEDICGCAFGHSDKSPQPPMSPEPSPIKSPVQRLETNQANGKSRPSKPLAFSTLDSAGMPVRSLITTVPSTPSPVVIGPPDKKSFSRAVKGTKPEAAEEQSESQ